MHSQSTQTAGVDALSKNLAHLYPSPKEGVLDQKQHTLGQKAGTGQQRLVHKDSAGTLMECVKAQKQ